MIVTSVVQYPDESPTGFWLAEAAHPYLEFVKNGWEVVFASVAGTAVPDPASVTSADAPTQSFWEEKKAELEAPTKLADVPMDTLTAEYEALYFVGGFGTMWDFPESAEAQAMIKAMLEAERVVAAVCHGPIVFLNVSNDDVKLVAEKKMTAFSTAEDEAMGKLEMVSKPSGPGTCQEALSEAGAKFQVGLPFEPQVCVDGLIMTGQNPASAGPLATAVVYHYDPIKAKYEPERLSLLEKRTALVAEMEAADKKFAADLAALKKQEESKAPVADKLEELQMKAVAGCQFRTGLLTDLDTKLERNAMARQMALDAKAAADAKAAEEE